MKANKILLVNTNTEKAPYPVPPAGLCLLAERLEGRYETRIYDGTFRAGSGLTDEISSFDPDVVGLGVRNYDNLSMRSPETYTAFIAREFMAPVRKCSGAPVVLGGAGFSVMPRALMETLGADFGIQGEAEEALPLLLEALSLGRDPAGIPGVLVRGKAAQSARPRPGRLPGASIGPSRVHRWIDLSPYRNRGSYPVQTRRGCPRGCVYCTYPLIEGREPRLRTPESVADEIAEIARAAPGMTVEFVDSVFNDPPGRAREICAAVSARRLGVRLRTMGVNPAGADGDLFRTMRGAGFAQIDMTPDSASPSVLAAMGKGFTAADLAAAAAGIRAAAMPVMWFFLFGGPGEDRSTFAETMEFIDRRVSGEDMVHMSAGIRIYPGTAMHAAAIREKMVDPADDLSAPKFYVSPAIGSERLVEMVLEASSTRPNCVPSWETAPEPGLIARAASLRSLRGLDEPMFRTLLRLRREDMEGGKKT